MASELPVESRRRPRDRKAQILATAAAAFGERGYHRVGVNDIAAELGISGPALYRHFPNKYALLKATALVSVRALLEAADGAGPGLSARLRALITVTIDNRVGGGIYRWEGRYLAPGDRAQLRADYAAVVARI